ncbi:MAG: DUF1501 domain-containing protein [Planctomycetaceae bacterium]|nr:DUF1501 domain-containing protein [Planctomycetaceae bacterium]
MGRRRLLEAGALGALGLSLPAWLRGQVAAAADPVISAPPGKAKACILMFMWGGPSQLDTFDLKPHAPAEVRGDFQPIDTNVPGIQICEHFERLARHADKLAIIRSLNHTDPAHLSSGHATLTGHRAPRVNSDADPPSDRDTPHLGSTLSKLRPGRGTLPSFVTLPWLTSHPAAPGGQAPGQTAGWLGKRYDPVVIGGDPNQPDWRVQELSLLEGVSLERLESRQALLAGIDQQRRCLDEAPAALDLDNFQQRAFGLLASPEARQAFDLAQEPDSVRARYGRNIHGQCALLARRLVERGVPLVSVNWHNDGRNFWDTHGDNFRRLKKDLIPPADMALASLLEDLDERGLLDETLIAWVGEFGRRPQITRNNAGREHWPFCYSGLLAGGGIRGGTVFGASDSQGARPALNPVSPQDYAATMLEALGIPANTTLADPLGRPLKICEGTPIRQLFG